MIETFNNMHGFYDPQTVGSFFNWNKSAGTRGHPFKLRKTTILTNQYAHCFITMLTIIYTKICPSRQKAKKPTDRNLT